MAGSTAAFRILTQLKVSPNILGLGAASKALKSAFRLAGQGAGEVAGEVAVDAIANSMTRNVQKKLGQGSRLRNLLDMTFAGIGQGIGQTLFFEFMRAASPASLFRAFTSGPMRMETAGVGLAGLLNSVGGMSMQQAIPASGALLKGLRRDAAAGAGGLGDYVEGMQRILGPSLMAGATLEQTRSLNRQALGVGFALRGQEGMRLAALDVVQVLNGAAGDRTTPFAAAALQGIGIQDVASVNSMSRPERLETLTRAFANFDEAVTLMGSSFEAQTETFMDSIRLLGLSFTTPLFDDLKSGLTSVNEVLGEISPKLERFAGPLGCRLP